MIKERPWHSLALGDIFAHLGSKREGLSGREANKRLQSFGPNTIEAERRRGTWRILIRQLLSPLIFLLIIAGFVTVFLGARLDAIVIFGAVLFNTLIGFFQEKRALEALEKLRAKQEFFTQLKRDGRWHQLPVEAVVVGDIILLRPGDRVPADARLVLSHNLETNEAILTGESLPVSKKTEILTAATALADRSNMVWMGTDVTDGKAEAVVVATGRSTEFGKISSLLASIKKARTPFEKKIVKLGHFLTIVILALTTLLIGIGLAGGKQFSEMFLIAVAVVVSAIPEGLPVAVTVILAIGMTRILAKKGLVKRLSATEALGSTSVILTDKTGTLTKGEMQVSRILTAVKNRGVFELDAEDTEESNHLLALEISLLASEAIIENPQDELHDWRVHGRPTDKALLMAAMHAGLSPEALEDKYQIIKEIPFNSERKFIATVRRTAENDTFVFFSGAPDVLLPHIKRAQSLKRTFNLTKDGLNDIQNTINKLANEGLRIILVGYKRFSKVESQEHLKELATNKWTELLEDAIFVGLIGLKDPVREDVPQTIELTRQAGIRTVIVTGDHALTARSVGKEVGLLRKGQTLFNVMEGRELAEIDAGELARQVRAIDIFARVTPSHKVKIIEAWQKQGEIVAMGGDGVNDAPALRRADVGIAVGTGTDIAKDTADIVLLENNFSTIVSAVKEGRVILDNLKKVITYLLADSLTEIILVSLTLLMGLPLPILPSQILWVNLVEDSFPSVALAFDPAEEDVMALSPQDTRKPLLDAEVKTLITIIGLLTVTVLIGLFVFFLNQTDDLVYVRTVIFVALAINSLFYAFALRSLRRPVWQVNFWTNKYLLGAILVGLALIAAAVYLPPLQVLLRTTPLGGLEWIILIGFGILNIIGIEMGKWFFIRRKKLKLSNQAP